MRKSMKSRTYGSKKYSMDRMKRLRHSLYVALTTMAKERKEHTVSVNDVHATLDALRVSKKDVEARLALTNKVFSKPMFKRTGYVLPSTRPAAKYRLVNEWKVSR